MTNASEPKSKDGEVVSLGERERQAADEIAGEIDEHLKLGLRAFNAALHALNAVPERPLAKVSQAEKVSVALLIRLANDIRCCSLLAARAYSLQACALAASVFEVAYTLVFIGTDEERAQEWIAHDDPTKPFRPAHTLVYGVLKTQNAEDSDAVVSRQYRTYRQLCMAKHSNPLLQMLHGYQQEENVVIGEVGPDTSEQAVRASWFALEHSAGLTVLAVSNFNQNFLPTERHQELQIELQHIEEKRVALRQRAIDRWGDHDPFEGEW